MINIYSYYSWEKNMKPCYKINLPINILNPNVDPLNFPINKVVTNKDLQLIDDVSFWLSQEFIDFCNDEYNFNPYTILFIRPPNNKDTVHIDGTLDSRGAGVIDRWAINYYWNWENSLMYWYEPKNDGYVGTKGPNIEVYHTRWQSNEVSLIHQECPKPASFIKTDIPHAVENFDELKTRYCLSIRPKSRDKKNTFEEAYTMFEKYLSED